MANLQITESQYNGKANRDWLERERDRINLDPTRSAEISLTKSGRLVLKDSTAPEPRSDDPSASDLRKEIKKFHGRYG